MQTFHDYFNRDAEFLNKNPKGIRLNDSTQFPIETNLSRRNIKDFKSFIRGYGAGNTGENLGVNYEEVIKSNTETFVNFDRENILNYASYGSLRNRFNIALSEIIVNFPGSLHVKNQVEGLRKNNILNYQYNSSSNISFFNIPVSCLENKFFLKYSQNDLLNAENNDLKNLTVSYERYEIYITSNKLSFKILNLEPSISLSEGYIQATVEGNPFPNSINGVESLSFHIKPKSVELNNFINSLDSLEFHMMNRDVNGNFNFKIKIPQEVETGRVSYIPLEIKWPRSDGYNIDYDTRNYSVYISDLLNLADTIDESKTNLLIRKYFNISLLEYGDTDGKIRTLLELYGNSFDKMKNFIDSIAYTNKVTYDKKDNIPDKFIKNLARSLGWDIVSVGDGVNVIENFVGQTENIFNEGIPAEVDYDLWRRIVLNSSYLFKSKGTKKSLKFLLSLIGIPDELISFNEHVYIAENKLNEEQTRVVLDNAISQETSGVYPNGFPRIIANSENYYFQSKGGWYKNESIIENEGDTQQTHEGNYDEGASYFQPFRNIGFNLNRVVDNKKSWVKIEKNNNKSSETRLTNYNVADDRLIFNSKEVELKIEPAKAIENAVYQFNKSNNLPIGLSGMSSLYPSGNYYRFEVRETSFVNYLQKITENFINARNRKTVFDVWGGGYPTLKMIYRDYVNLIGTNNAISYDIIVDYLDLLESYWLEIVDQMIPSTTIISDKSITYKNTIFDAQKFRYKKGVNDGSEFSTRVPGSGATVTVTPLKFSGTEYREIKAEIRNMELRTSNLYIGFCLSSNTQFASVRGNLVNVGEWEVSQIQNTCQGCFN